MRSIILFKFFVFILINSSASASEFSTYLHSDERKRLGDYENCGSQPEQPNFIESLYNSSQKKSLNNHIECKNQNSRRQFIDSNSEINTLVFNTRKACESKIRTLSKTASTLSFSYGNGYSAGNGLNGAGVDTTDGGYSVRVSGSDIDGSLNVICYMNKSFVVTNIR